MKKLQVLVLLLFAFVLHANAQKMQVVKDMEVAKEKALSSNKMIIVDFTATWCGPCRKLEQDLWDTKEFKALGDKYIFLKVDVDKNRALAAKYQVRSIPKVMVLTAKEEVLYTESGYQPSNYLEKFRSLSKK